MYLRISRLRFVLVRCCFLLIILLFLLEIKIFLFYNDNSSKKSPMEISFWQQLYEQDQLLTDEQRVKQLESIEQQRMKIEPNWTNIFFNIYRRKLARLDQRDMKTSYKYRTIENRQNFLQTTFEIFEETPVFERPKFCSSKHIFHPQCPYKNCIWSCDKSPMNHENIRRANIFHHVDIKPEDIHEKQKYRSHHDIWILWVDEANRQIEHLNEYKFNWTLSFRQDSEISIGTYGLIIESDNNNYIHANNNSDAIMFSSDFLYILQNHSILLSDITLENYILTNYRYRSKHALWFVSNCEPKQRLNYYEQLQRYFPVDAYGSCINNVKKTCNKNDQCENDQFRLAFFYLAFESQTCTDYITEKFWRALHYGMIPIVFGPRKQSYLDLGVPKSAFIHVEDFSSPKQLGKYLHNIVNDYFLYRDYFQWRNQYEIFYETNDLEPVRMCELCMRMNMQDQNEHRFYSNIHQWHRSEC
ncbi:unnamed protein product [Rotaria socialis]|uniref:Fucosyltransferase n=1 Tax=Rotaria socialis TaxID=392032 RepID=A0A819A3I6_9BILA|nr:unnamed protein product [Rotaria socialis]CAF4405173.1 unnamed protein product [Rotaria socialis]